MTDKKFFYLLSYPRCRSTWFSQFLSTNVSRCFHEALSSNNENAFKYLKNWPAEYVGSSDTNPISFARVNKATGPMVIINRPIADVKNSITKSFVKHDAFTDDEWNQYIDNTLDMFTIFLDWYRENQPNAMHVDFSEMEEEKVLMRIFTHCVPRHDPPWEYVKYMNNLRITIKNEKGMHNGIESSIKNRGTTIEDFKARHLEKYDRDEFKESVWKGWEETPDIMVEEEKKIVLAS